MKPIEYTVEFRILGETVNPTLISSTLNVLPCQTQILGTLRSDGSAQKGMWVYNGGIERRDWSSLSEGLTFVVDKLWEHREAIRRFGQDAKLVWWCGVFKSASVDGGPTLSADLLRRLGEFGAELYLDIYQSNFEMVEQPDSR